MLNKNADCIELMKWIMDFAFKEYELDTRLRVRGQNTLLKIATKAEQFLREKGELK